MSEIDCSSGGYRNLKEVVVIPPLLAKDAMAIFFGILMEGDESRMRIIPNSNMNFTTHNNQQHCEHHKLDHIPSTTRMNIPIVILYGPLWVTLFFFSSASAWTSPQRVTRCFHSFTTTTTTTTSTSVDLTRSLSSRPSSALYVMDMEDFFEDGMKSDETMSYSVRDDEEEEILTDEELEATMGEWDDRIARFNTVHLTGRIGNDPEPRYFDDGKVVLNLSLASKRKYHSLERKERNIRSGEEETDWYGLEIWGQTAEFAAKYVDKGARVGVIGSLQIDQWNDKETGEVRERTKVVVRDLDILETRAEADLRRSNRRGPSFYTNDDSDDDGSPSSAGSGGFFD